MRRCAEVGAAFVELAVALPVLVVLVLGTADFARVIYYAIELTNAARAGAQYAGYNSAQATQSADITAAAQAGAPNIAPVTITFSSPSPLCRCGADDGSAFTGPVACDSTCVSGHTVETVTVTATRTFNTISRFPGIPNRLTLSRSAAVRVPL